MEHGIKEKKNRCSRGSITVECMIILIPFMLAFFLLLNIARFVEAEMIIHHAITQSAKEISTYSYLATKAGITQQMQSTNKKTAAAKAEINQTLDSLNTFGSALGDGDLASAYKAGQQVYDNVDSIISDYENIPGKLVACLKTDGEGLLFTALVGLLAKSSIEKQIKITGKDPDTYLKNLGVVDGLDGLDFSKSKWNTTTERPGNVRIVVTFKLKNKMFGMFDIGEHKYALCASTLLW